MKKIYSKSVWLILSVIMTFLLTEVTVRGSKIVSGYIDILKEGTSGGIRLDVKLLIAFVIVGFILAFFKQYFAQKYSQEIVYYIKSSLQEKVLYLKANYFEDNNSGTVINKLNSDISIIEMFFTNTIGAFLQSLILVVVIGASIFKLDIGMGIFISFICLVILMFSALTAIRFDKLAILRRGLYDDLASTASDQLKGIHTVRSYNAIDRSICKINESVTEILENEKYRIKLSKTSWFIQRFTTWFPSVIVPPFMLYMYVRGEITVGEITYLILILGQLFMPFSDFPTIFIEIVEGSVSLRRIKSIFDFEDELLEKDKEALIDFDNEYAVNLKNIEFNYNTEFRALHGVSLEVKKGESVALVGSSGCGKSTIFKIICGFNKVEIGEYLLFGSNTKELAIDEIRRSIAIVSQEDFVINGTILENIRFGDKNASLDEVIEMCKKANIHDTIMSFENQYDTVVGDGGQVLSGGERQRISIARALLKKAPIMLLDEPTSALDVKNEQIMIDTLNKIKGETTIITIAHRLSTIIDYDRIVVMDSGKIVEMGNKDELMDKKGYFYKLKVAEELGGEANV